MPNKHSKKIQNSGRSLKMHSVPYTIDFSTLGDGSLPPLFTGSTWSIASGKALNTPVGVELLTNGSMEADANWGNQGSPTTNERSNEQAHGGTYSRKIVSDAVNEGCVQTKALTALIFYLLDVWLYVSVGSAQYSDINGVLVLSVATIDSTIGSWVNSVRTGHCLGAGTGYFCPHAKTAISTFYADDISLKSLTTSQLTAAILTNRSDVQVKAAWTIVKDTQCGVWVCQDAAKANGVIVVYDGTYLRMLKLVNGVLSSVGYLGSPTYAAGAYVECRKSGTTFQGFYNGVQVGANQTVTDASIISNKIHGLFSAYSGNTCTAFSLITN